MQCINGLRKGSEEVERMDECGEEPEMRLSGRAWERWTKNKLSLEQIFASKSWRFCKSWKAAIDFFKETKSILGAEFIVVRLKRGQKNDDLMVEGHWFIEPVSVSDGLGQMILINSTLYYGLYSRRSTTVSMQRKIAIVIFYDWWLLIRGVSNLFF